MPVAEGVDIAANDKIVALELDHEWLVGEASFLRAKEAEHGASSPGACGHDVSVAFEVIDIEGAGEGFLFPIGRAVECDTAAGVGGCRPRTPGDPHYRRT
jgi:hypothetical protein